MTADALTWRTRLHFATIATDCITGAINGEFHVNDLDDYVRWQLDIIRDGMAGLHDHSFTFWQMRNLFETGECVPLLAPTN